MSEEVVSTAQVEDPEEIATDAVCGMPVDVELARDRDLITVFAEREYAFCGGACRDRFLAEPVAYAVAGRSTP